MDHVKTNLRTWRDLMTEAGCDADSHPSAWGQGLPDDTPICISRDGTVSLANEDVDLVITGDAVTFDGETWARLCGEQSRHRAMALIEADLIHAKHPCARQCRTDWVIVLDTDSEWMTLREKNPHADVRGWDETDREMSVAGYTRYMFRDLADQ
jgi:hypothetical protein